MTISPSPPPVPTLQLDHLVAPQHSTQLFAEITQLMSTSKTIGFFPEPYLPTAPLPLHSLPSITSNGTEKSLQKRSLFFSTLQTTDSPSCPITAKLTAELHQITHSLQTIEPIKKQNVFAAKVTAQEAEVIALRISLQQQQHAAYQRLEQHRRFLRLRQQFAWLCTEEVQVAFDEELVQSEEEAVQKFAQLEFIHALRKTIAQQHQLEAEAVAEVRKRRSRYSQLAGEAKPRVYKVHGRLPLDEALAQLARSPANPEACMKGWSTARVRAYKCIRENPNAYFYRFNAPGEAQMNGPWSEAERELFLQRLREVGADGNWGIFASAIPGRVGYQCSNFYRKLLEEGAVKDSNYYLGKDKKWHYCFSNRGTRREYGEEEKAKKTGKKGGKKERDSSDEEDEEAERPVKKEARKKPQVSDEEEAERPVKKEVKKKSLLSDEEEAERPARRETKKRYSYSSEDSEEEEPIKPRRGRKEESRPNEETDSPAFDNPLPGFIDPITLEAVKRPAISPYGHVMGYDSWLRCLAQEGDSKNICPLTKKPLKKRELVILTVENIEKYRSKIVNNEEEVTEKGE